jgi:hypothetical protein
MMRQALENSHKLEMAMIVAHLVDKDSSMGI